VLVSAMQRMEDDHQFNPCVHNEQMTFAHHILVILTEQLVKRHQLACGSFLRLDGQWLRTFALKHMGPKCRACVLAVAAPSHLTLAFCPYMCLPVGL
jgi:hypothetical protein